MSTQAGEETNQVGSDTATAAAAAAGAATTSFQSSPLELDRLRGENWTGSIPVILTLASTSLSSPTIPPPIHVLVSRHCFLHVALKDAVLRLHKFAPPTISFTRRVVEEPEPGEGNSGDEKDGSSGGGGGGGADGGNTGENNNNNNNNNTQNDAEDSDQTASGGGATKNPEGGKSSSGTATSTRPTTVPNEESYPQCWFEDEMTDLPLRWQLFAGVLFDSLQKVPARQQQDDKAAVSQQKLHEDNLPWKIRLHFTSYPHSQLLALDTSSGVLTTVERTFKNSLKQALVLQHGHAKVALNITKQSHQRLWDSIVTSKYSMYKPIQNDIQASTLTMIPVRVSVDSSQPLIQKRCDGSSELTLGELLVKWTPQYFEMKSIVAGENDNNSSKMTTAVQPKRSDISWRVAGVVPSLNVKLLDLWMGLCHPDNFLYVSLLVT